MTESDDVEAALRGVAKRASSTRWRYRRSQCSAGSGKRARPRRFHLRLLILGLRSGDSNAALHGC